MPRVLQVTRSLALVATALFTISAGPTSAPSNAPFAKEIAAFQEQDRISPPAPGGVLFVGDSGIRMWKSLAQDFPNQHVINRGFGGSTMAHLLLYTDRIVIPYKPRLIIVREGGNDLSAAKPVTPEELVAEYDRFVKAVRKSLPDVRIAFCSLNPNPARWNQAETRKRINALTKAYVASGKNLDFIEVWDQFLTPEGIPRADLFLKDGLHNNAEGYKVYADIVRRHL